MKTHDIYKHHKNNIIRSINPVLANVQVLWVMNESQNGASYLIRAVTIIHGKEQRVCCIQLALD